MKKFDPGHLTVQQLHELFRYLGVEMEFRIVPNPDSELWVKVTEERNQASALLAEAQDLLHHVSHNGQKCPGCDLEERIDDALSGVGVSDD